MIIGWVGAFMLALCGLPQAIECIRRGNAEGLNLTFLLLWTAGEIATLFAISTDAPLYYLFLNYGLNLVFLTVIWRYKLWPRELIKS